MSQESITVLKTNILFPKHKIPKLFIIYFLFLQTLGLDFGFGSVLKRKYRLTVQIITRVLSLLVSIIMLANLALFYDSVWYWINIVKYNAFILLLFTTRYNLYNLIYDINGICDFTTKQIKILIIIEIVYITLMNLMIYILLTVRCIWKNEAYCRKFGSMFLFFFNVGIGASLNTIAVTQVISTYYFKCGINLLQVLLKKPMRRLNVFEKSYMAIADCYDKIRPFYDWITILKVGIIVPEIMGTIWSCTLYIKGNGQWFSYITEFVFTFHLMTQIFVPAILVELLNSEVDATRQLLNQEIMEEKDKKQKDDLKRILHYIKERPLRHLVWRFIPIDLHLLLTLFSLCTSYFIVALQFSQII